MIPTGTPPTTTRRFDARSPRGVEVEFDFRPPGLTRTKQGEKTVSKFKVGDRVKGVWPRKRVVTKAGVVVAVKQHAARVQWDEVMRTPRRPPEWVPDDVLQLIPPQLPPPLPPLGIMRDDMP